MPDLWGYKKDALLRAAKEINPDTVEVTLLSGLYAVATLKSGKDTVIPECAFGRLLTFADQS